MQHLGKAALRVTKNYTKGYSDTQAKVREATSNDPWGPSGTQMNEIAQLTYNQGDFVEIMEMLDKRLNDKGKNWRHVFKSLTLLDYCLHAGSENVVIYFRDNLYVIKTLKEFQYIDEEGKDQGANVRQKAKDITNLLQDESRLREERRSRAHMRDRMIKANGGEEGGPSSFDEDENVVRRRNNRGPGAGAPKEDDELKRAIEESKRSHAVEQAKAAEERDLEQAIKLSEEEEAKRNKAVEDSNSSALFDDTNQLPPPTTTNPFPLNDANPYANLQPQFTQLQPQFTSMQPQFTAAIQPQFTSFNPYQQQAQQEALQAEYLRQQQEFLAQQQAAQQQQQQQEEWLRQQQLLQMQQQQAQLQQQNTSLFAPQQPLAPQPTGFGTNNPFAPSPSAFSPAQLGPSPTASRGPSFNLQGTYANSSAPSFTSSPSITPSISHSSSPVSGPGQSRLPAVKTKNDEQHAQLASLFANKDDGMDTFGNTGILRYGQSDAGRLVAAQTGGHNPFARQQQQQQGADKPFFDI
ncbi:hypothetical protein EYR40_002232 [Pleurotus pulmonarius]|nr:hypothetical protein EYR36_002275 [Pleurotus pulmonarius]KAF4583741.1 hypothetical protein EYR40_002232 [Pleurotus pulmonarius]